jgi:hypothetical protein
VAVFAADQDAAVGSWVSDPRRQIAAFQLGRRTVAEIGEVALTGVDDQESGVTGGSEDVSQGRNDGAEWTDVVAQRLTEAAGFVRSRVACR